MTMNNKSNKKGASAPVQRDTASNTAAEEPGFDKKLDGPNRPST
jgi:hypothetical protein